MGGIANGQLHVVDARSHELLVYDLNGVLGSQRPLPVENPITSSARELGGHTFVLEEWRPDSTGLRAHLDRLELTTDSVTTFATLAPQPSSFTPATGYRIQDGRLIWTALEGRVVTMSSDRPIYDVLDLDGALRRRITVPLSRRAVTREELVEIPFASAFGPGRIALTNAMIALSDTVFATLQSSLWRAAEDPDIPESQIVWRLISVRGRPLGSLWVPYGTRVTWVDPDHLWGITRDSLGVASVARFRLVPPRRSPQSEAPSIR